MPSGPAAGVHSNAGSDFSKNQQAGPQRRGQHLRPVILAHGDLALARHAVPINAKAVVEAFPSSFLGVMLEDPTAVPARRQDCSDVFFQHLVRKGGLQRLLNHLLPGRSLTRTLAHVTNHDERAALVYALTVLGMAAREFIAVGDADGWIILPPEPFLQGWALADLQANAAAEAPGALHMSAGPGPA